MVYDYIEADGEMPLTEVERLRNRLKAMGAKQLRISHGSRPATAEEVAGEVNRALDAIERGDFEEVE